MLSAAMARAAALDDKAAGQYARVNPDWLVALIDHAARVAVLEQQIAAIEALIDEAVDEARRQASTEGPVDPGMLLEYLAQISAALAAGVDPKGSMVVDNPSEGSPS